MKKNEKNAIYICYARVPFVKNADTYIKFEDINKEEYNEEYLDGGFFLVKKGLGLPQHSYKGFSIGGFREIITNKLIARQLKDDCGDVDFNESAIINIEDCSTTRKSQGGCHIGGIQWIPELRRDARELLSPEVIEEYMKQTPEMVMQRIINLKAQAQKIYDENQNAKIAEQQPISRAM